MSEQPWLRMPVGFGPTVSPRYAPGGGTFDPATSQRRIMVQAVFDTDADAVRALLPPGLETTEEPRIAFEFTYLSELAWLAGRGYNLVGVRVSARHPGDSPLDGWFQPVVWENLCEPILSGREELGWSKIFCDLPPAEETDGACRARASWDGFEFLTLELDGLETTDAAGTALVPIFHRKYIPATGDWGRADVDYLTVTPAGGHPPTLLDRRAAGNARVVINRPRWEDMPTQHHIVGALADIPIGDFVSGGVTRTRGGKDLSDQYRLG